MNNKVSVIIPVYGVEKYLDRCVESVVGQSYTNLEIILVDDGSPDSCPEKCDEWAKKDQRIIVVHKKNGGLSSARNTGLDYATGDYISFLDSDDWLALDTYEYCISLLELTSSDCIQFGILTTRKYISNQTPNSEKYLIYSGKEILQFYMASTTKRGGYSVCICIFPSALAKKYKFREGKVNEDIDYKFKVFRDCNQLVVSDDIKYFYWQEGNSISSGPISIKDFQLYEAADELYKLCQQETYGTIAFLGAVKKARTPFSLLCRLAIWGLKDTSLDYNNVVRKLVSDHRKSLSILLKSPIPLSRKILSVLFAINYKFTQVVIAVVKERFGLYL